MCIYVQSGIVDWLISCMTSVADFEDVISFNLTLKFQSISSNVQITAKMSCKKLINSIMEVNFSDIEFLFDFDL